MDKYAAAADRGGRESPTPGQKSAKTFFAGASRFRAAVAAREFLHPTRGVDELLFAGEKRMASGADTDFNVRLGRTGVINRTARAGDSVS